MIDEWAEAYYYSFQLTGVEKVDNLLRAIARAGKSFHHTDQWSDPQDWMGDKSYIDLIQEAANELAEEFAKRVRAE